MSYGYQPVKPIARYRVVMDGYGKLVIEVRNLWFKSLLYGEKYSALCGGINDLAHCDSIIAELKLRATGKANFRHIVKEYT